MKYDFILKFSPHNHIPFKDLFELLKSKYLKLTSYELNEETGVFTFSAEPTTKYGLFYADFEMIRDSLEDYDLLSIQVFGEVYFYQFNE